MKGATNHRKVTITAVGYDFDFDLEVGPLDPKNFWGEVIIRTSIDGQNGFTDYLIYIGTPLSLVSHFNEIFDHIKTFHPESPQCVFGKGLILLDAYDIDIIESAIDTVAENIDFYAFDVS